MATLRQERLSHAGLEKAIGLSKSGAEHHRPSSHISPVAAPQPAAAAAAAVEEEASQLPAQEKNHLEANPCLDPSQFTALTSC